MTEQMTEKVRVEVVEGPNGSAEVFEEFESNQAMKYSVVFNGKTETFMSLGEAYIEAGIRAGKHT